MFCKLGGTYVLRAGEGKDLHRESRHETGSEVDEGDVALGWHILKRLEVYSDDDYHEVSCAAYKRCYLS